MVRVSQRASRPRAQGRLFKALRIEAFSAAGTCTRITIENVEFHALGNVEPNKQGPEVREPPHSGLAAIRPKFGSQAKHFALSGRRSPLAGYVVESLPGVLTS